MLLRRRSRDLDHAREFDAHIQIEIDENLAKGMQPEEARRAAYGRFGSPTAIREQVWESGGVRFLDALIRDVRFAIRVLAGSRTFTLVSAATLALGIGAAAAIFTIVNGVLLRPLPYSDPDHLVTAWETNPAYNLPGKPPGCVSFSPGNYLDLRDRNRSFAQIGAFYTSTYNLAAGGAPDRIVGGLISAPLFSALGVRPALGRLLLPSDDNAAADRVAVISHALWEERFASSPAAIGASLRLDDRSHVIVGVAPADFRLFGEDVDVWLPLERKTDPQTMHWRYSYYLRIIARLKPGVTINDARQDVDTVVQAIRRQSSGDLGKGGTVVPLLDQTVGRVRGPLWILFAAAIFVLLIACANVAHLSLGRGLARRREIALRIALGAGRRRVLAQLFTESLLLALAGAAPGIAAARLGVRVLLHLAPGEIPRASEIHVDGWVLGFAAGAAALCAIVFGLLPALGIARDDPQHGLQRGCRASAGRSAGRARGLLVVSEIAAALVLMIGAALMIESFRRVSSVNAGFDARGLVAMRVALSPSRYDELDRQNDFYRRVLDRLRNLPGIQAAGAIDGLPFTDGGFDNSFLIDGRPEPPPGKPLQADIRRTDAGYFQAIGIPLVEGRGFNGAERADSPPTVIISRSMERKYWAGERAVGKRVTILFGPPGGIHAEVVGVAADVHSALDSRPNDIIYLPYSQGRHVGQMDLVLRLQTGTAAGSLGRTVRTAVASIDPDQPVFRIRTMESLLAASLATRRFQMLLLSLFAAFAASLSAVGLYGVLAYSVQARTREIGIRSALGADQSEIASMMLGNALRMAAGGIAIGVAAALALTRILASLLYEVRPTEPAVFAAVSLLLLAIAAASAVIPARRAAHIDPIAALRHD